MVEPVGFACVTINFIDQLISKPAFSKPASIPPTPANKPPTVNFLLSGIQERLLVFICPIEMVKCSCCNCYKERNKGNIDHYFDCPKKRSNNKAYKGNAAPKIEQSLKKQLH